MQIQNKVADNALPKPQSANFRKVRLFVATAFGVGLLSAVTPNFANAQVADGPARADTTRALPKQTGSVEELKGSILYLTNYIYQDGSVEPTFSLNIGDGLKSVNGELKSWKFVGARLLLEFTEGALVVDAIIKNDRNLPKIWYFTSKEEAEALLAKK